MNRDKISVLLLLVGALLIGAFAVVTMQLGIVFHLIPVAILMPALASIEIGVMMRFNSERPDYSLPTPPLMSRK